MKEGEKMQNLNERIWPTALHASALDHFVLRKH